MGLENAKPIPTLAVTDLQRARDFYERLLGCEEYDTPTPGKDVMYRFGKDSYLYLYERPTPAGSTATVCAFSVENVEKTVEELRGKGATFEEYDLPDMELKTVNGIAEHDGMKSAWLKDPSGNILAIDDTLAVLSRRLSGSRPGAQRPETPAQH